MGSAEAFPTKSAVLHRHLRLEFPRVVKGEGNYLILDDGRQILDASGGASVACIGHGDLDVQSAVLRQMNNVSYCATTYYTTEVCEQLCKALVDSTKGKMSRAYIVNSGSEAMEAALKLARQYFLEKIPSEPKRFRFIARSPSYHGTTLGALSVGGHKARRAKFTPMLLNNVSQVSPCYEYRNRYANETEAEHVQRLAAELDKEFQRVGPETVCAFIAEPVVGAALGCVPPVEGYFRAVQEVCHKYGALLILDEVMCGMGRTGTIHAWEQEGIVPDIQTLGKCLGGGYQPIAGVLISNKIISALEQGSGAFVHGHTYQGHPVACAAALEVQRIIREQSLLENVREMGALLSALLQQKVGGHPHVGNIRGRGLFWGIEFVADKSTTDPFPSNAEVAMRISEMGLTKEYCIAVYPGTGTADGINGDHIIISPPYNITIAEIHHIVDTVARLVRDFFSCKDFKGTAA